MSQFAETHAVLKHVVNVWAYFEQDCIADRREVFLSYLHLRAAVDNALVDLRRMSDFHLTTQGNLIEPPLPDRHKYAGFLAKWIAKVRPIQLRNQLPLSLTNAQKLELNSLFAVHVMTSLLEHMIPLVMARHIRYWLTFRDERGETLAMTAYCAEQIASLMPDRK